KLSLGESDVRRPRTHTLKITNSSDQDVTYTTSFTDALSTAGTPDEHGTYLGGAIVDMPQTVTVRAGRTAKVRVTITPDPELEELLAVYGGYLEFTADGVETLRVPFAGFAGDYQDLPLLSDWAGFDLPAMVELVECDRLIGVDCVKDGGWDFVEAGHHYSMKDGDVPSVALFLEHPAESITLKAFRVLPNGKRVSLGHNLAKVERYVGRNSDGISVYTWDGTLTNKRGKVRVPAPKGTYVLEVTAVNALGSAKNQDHVETWTSEPFSIDKVEQRPTKPGKPR